MYVVALTILVLIDSILIFPYRRDIKATNVLLIGFMVYVALNVRQTPDISNYITRFTYNYAGHDNGFTFLAHFFRDHGAEFYEFQSFYYLVALSCIVYGLLRLTDQRTLIYILYFFFPFLLNLVQLRNFMILAFLVLAIGMCYGNDNRIAKRIWWCVLCALAATQHLAAVAYIPFVFIWNNKKIINKIIIGSSILTLLLLIAPGNLVGLITNIVKFVADETRADRYGMRATKLGVIVMVAESIAMMLIAKFSGDFVNSYNEELAEMGSSHYIESSHFDFVINLLYYSSVFWPFYYLHGNFTRLMQNEFLIVYMAIATLLHYALSINWKAERNIKMTNSFVVSVIAFIPIYIYNLLTIWGELYKEVVVPILGSLF